MRIFVVVKEERIYKIYEVISVLLYLFETFQLKANPVSFLIVLTPLSGLPAETAALSSAGGISGPCILSPAPFGIVNPSPG